MNQNRSPRPLPRILVCGPNPSWQKTLPFDVFHSGEINRACECDCRASGKGVNFARAVRTWGTAVPVVYQFIGGTNGRRIEAWLQREGIRSAGRTIADETRCCTTVLCRKCASMTELIEPSPTVTPDDVESLTESILSALPDADALALCGTLPKGPLDGFYAGIAAEAVRAGKPVLMDSVEHFDETLAAGVHCLKINSDELLKVTGASETDDSEAAALELLKRFPLECAAITDGPGRAFIASRDALHRIFIPTLSGVCNPIGAGDVCSGVMLSELLAGTDPLNAFTTGIAAACASCLTQYAADFDRTEALRIRNGMRAEAVTPRTT
jgi:tagatose 6-phosphate kinase